MMALRRPEAGPMATAVGGTREAEPASTTEWNFNRSYCESVDSDVDETSKDMTISREIFPKYVDCQETLVEMSFIKWMSGFRVECRRLRSNKNSILFYGLLNFYNVNVAPEMVDCRNKINKSTLLKTYIEQCIVFFHLYYKDLKEKPSEFLEAVYFDKMSSLLAYAIDLNLMASQRYKDGSWLKKTSSKINSLLQVCLHDNIDYMIDTIFHLYYVFYGSNHSSLGSIMLQVFKKLLAERTIPRKLKFFTYLRYILCFKLWKKTIHSSNLTGSDKRKEMEQIRLLLRALIPPNDFMVQHENHNMTNWPKLTMTPNGTPATIARDLKNVTFVLYGANLSLKDCHKDIMDASRCLVTPSTMKSIEEQCKNLRPDLFSIGGKQVLDNWSLNFDLNLKPLIPTTRSCNSLLRQIKYNLLPENTTCEENQSDTKIPEIQKNSKNDSPISTVVESSESYKVQSNENELKCTNEKKSEKPDNLSLKNKLTEENKQSENVPNSTKVLKTVSGNSESFPANSKQRSNENEMLVINKRSKLSEKLVAQQRNEDVHKVDTSSSKNMTKMQCNADSTNSHTSSSECFHISSKKIGSKRTQPTFFSENDSIKRICKTKSRHEKNINGNLKQGIDSDYQNLNNENICYNTLDNDDSLHEHGKNSQDTNEVFRLKSESAVKENKWLTKVSSSNLKHTLSDFSDGEKDKNIVNSISKVTELNNHQDENASLSSDEVQWPLKLSPCDPDSPEVKPIITHSDQAEVESTSSDIEGNNSPKTENILSLRNSEELISNLVSSRRSVNENESTQVYAVSMDQKLTHIEHPYVENAINSSTRDLEVVNVLSPVSINSTDIPMNKSSWVPDILVHTQNDHNDVDGDHSQSSTQQLNNLCNSNSINMSRVANSEVEHLNHTQLETPLITRPCPYNRMESRVYPEDSYTTTLSPIESSVSNSGYGSAYDVKRLPLAVSVKSIPVAVSPKNVIHELNDSSKNVYHGNTINLSFNGLKKKSSIEPQQSYQFPINETMPTDMSTTERISPSKKDKNDIELVSDGFSDVDSMDLRINSTECKETNSCINNLPMSSLISKDLNSINTLSSFDKSGSWCTIKNPSESPNIHQKLKIYTDPTKLITGPVNLNTQPGIPINLNEAHVQKVFLGNKSPSQVYYNPLAERDRVSDKYIHSVLQPTDNDPNVKQSLLSYDSVLNQSSSIMNSGLLYKFPRSDGNPSVRYENSLQHQHKNPDCISPHNGLTYSGFDQILGSNLLEDPNHKEESGILNMTQIMLQSGKNCKVHYKWPLNKNKSQTTTSNGKIQETSQCLDYKNGTNMLFNYTEDELNQTRLQNVSPNEIKNQNSGFQFSERKGDNTSYQSTQQFQDISNLVASDLSPTIQSGSNSIDEKKQTQPRVINTFECNTRKEQLDHPETMYRNAKMSSQSKESSTTLGIEVFEAAHQLFNCGELFLCMYPKCTNSHHFRVIPSNAEMLRHEFTVPFDDFRFNIQYKYKQLLTSNPRTWPSIPELVQLAKRCLCEICGDFDSKLNQNQDMLHTYVEGKKPNIEDNNENEQPANPQIRLSWKKNLAHRFTSEAVEKQSISQMVEDMERHINRFTHAFMIIFPLNKDAKTNSQNLQNACESYSDINDNDKPLSPECIKNLEIGHKRFNKDMRLHSYQYIQLSSKVIPKYVLEELSNSPYQPPNQNVLNNSHQFDEEHLPNELNRYFVNNSPSPSYSSVNSNLTSQSLKYIHENIPNTSHQTTVENSPSTSRQSSVGNLTNSHQPILNNFPTTSHGISLNSCSLNDRTQNPSHMSRYYADGQMYTEFSHAYLQVPNAQFPNSSTNSYYSSPVNMPSDNSVPFCSPSLSLNSVPNSPSSDCSIPSLVETVATAVPEHALLDDSLEAVNAAHNLMLISNRHRYNSTTSITTTNTTDTITVTASTTINVTTVSNTNIFSTDLKTNNPSSTDTTTIVTPTDVINNSISSPDTTNNNISITDIATDRVQSSITELEDQETDIVHNSRRKKKKKHDKKKDKKKKGKR